MYYYRASYRAKLCVVYANNRYATVTQAFPRLMEVNLFILIFKGLYYYEQYPIQFIFLSYVPAITQDVYTGLLTHLYILL